MTADLFTQYAQLDPAKADDAQPDWDSVGPVLLSAIDEGMTMTQTTQTTDDRRQTKGTKVPRRWTGAWVAVAAFAVIAIAAFAATQLFANDAPPADEILPAPPFESAVEAAEAYHLAVSIHDAEYAHSLLGADYSGYQWIGPDLAETQERFAFNEAFGSQITLLECEASSVTSASCIVTRTDPYEIAMFGVAGNYRITVRLDDMGFISSTSWQTAPSEFTKDLSSEWGQWVNGGNTLPFIELFPGLASDSQLEKTPEEAAAFLLAEIERFLAEHEG